MKGNEGSGDPEGQESKSGLALSGRGLDTSAEMGFFADICTPFLNCCRSLLLRGRWVFIHNSCNLTGHIMQITRNNYIVL